MANTIVITGNKLEAASLVSAISNDQDPSSFEWEGEVMPLRSVAALLASSCGCSSSRALDAFLALRALTALTLSFNGISTLHSFACLELLQHLDVSHNKISDLEGLRDLKQLRSLRCNNNQISSIEPLRNVTTITELWISNNNIGWESVINLQPNSELTHIVIHNNPMETKAKIEDFLKAICVSLETINGVQNAWDNGGDFLATSDGRVMLTQARSQLTPLQREDMAGTSTAMKRKASSKALLRSGTLKALVRSRAGEDLSTVRAIASAGGNLSSNNNEVTSPSKSEPATSRVFKAQRNKKTSGIGQKYVDGHRIEISAAGNGTLPCLQSDSNDRPDIAAESSSPKGSEALMSQAAQSAVNTDASVTLHFGKDRASPAAVCLYPNGTGYTRWTRAGTVACSFEAGGRLFSSHKTGALAAVVSPDGSGSVMDEHGNSVLSLKSSGEAIIFNTAGEIECNIKRQSISEDRADKQPEVLTIYDGSARKKAQKINLGEMFAQAEKEIYGYTLQWVFLDMFVEFVPATWEIIVNVSNGRADCVFSSIRGGSIAPVRDGSSPKKKSHISAKKVVKNLASQPLLSDTEHNSLRTGLQSIMSEMDDMLADMKKKTK